MMEHGSCLAFENGTVCRLDYPLGLEVLPRSGALDLFPFFLLGVLLPVSFLCS